MTRVNVILGAIFGFIIGGFIVGLFAYNILAFMTILVLYPSTKFIGFTPILSIPQAFDIFLRCIGGTLLIGLIGAAISAVLGMILGVVYE